MAHDDSYSYEHRWKERKCHAGDDVHGDCLLLGFEGDALHLLRLCLRALSEDAVDLDIAVLQYSVEL